VAGQWWHMDDWFADISRDYRYRVSEFACALCFQHAPVAVSIMYHNAYFMDYFWYSMLTP